MAHEWGSVKWRASLDVANTRKQERYQARKADSRCTDCGRKLDVARVRCAECLESTNDSIRQRKADDSYDPGGSRIDADARSAFSHEVERACVDAYRVERYSTPAASWEVVIYAKPLARAREHAERLRASYRLAEISTYPHVRVVDSKGNEL